MEGLNVHPVVRRLLVFTVVLLFACIGLTALLLFYSDNDILVAKWRGIAGLLTASALFALPFRRQRFAIPLAGLMCTLPLVLLSITVDIFIFQSRQPLTQYAAVRRVKDDDIESDEIWLKTAPVVKMLQRQGTRHSKTRGDLYIERYLYSWRTGLLMGKVLGEGKGSPHAVYEVSGVSAWLFPVRAACEQFTFYLVTLFPAALVAAVVVHLRGRPLKYSSSFPVASSVIALPAFLVGLVPLLSP